MHLYFSGNLKEIEALKFNLRGKQKKTKNKLL